jgi:hypothetical protein
MNSSLRIIALAVLFFAASALAANKPSKSITPTFANEVTAVDGKSITISLSSTKEKKYNISEATKVTVNYKPAKIEDVKPGMKATVTQHAGAEVASSVTAVTVKTKGKR